VGKKGKGDYPNFFRRGRKYFFISRTSTGRGNRVGDLSILAKGMNKKREFFNLLLSTCEEEEGSARSLTLELSTIGKRGEISILVRSL